MLISAVVRSEAKRNAQMICEYEELIKGLPKGSLICRKKEYYYLKYREGDRVFDKYIGKDGDAVTHIRDQLALRKHYTEMLSALKKEQKVIQKMLEGLV